MRDAEQRSPQDRSAQAAPEQLPPGSALLRFRFGGREFTARAGASLAAALLAAGVRVLGHNADGTPRGLFCGMGACLSCRVTVEGRGEVRACMTPVRDGMRVRPTAWPGAVAPSDTAGSNTAGGDTAGGTESDHGR